MTDDDQYSAGLLSSLGRGVGNAVAALHECFEVFAAELQEEKARAIELLFWAAGILLLGMMAVIILTITVVFIFNPQHRVFALGAFSLLYFAGLVWCVWQIRLGLQKQPSSFAETREQLRKDRACLDSLG